MKINPKVLALVERQIGIEEFSSRVYLDMANWCGLKGYSGAQSYYNNRASEELKHRDKIINFLLDCNYPVKLKSIPEPDNTIVALEDTINSGLAHEQKVSAAIMEIMKAAEEVEDFNSEDFFIWFVNEQREEEATFIDLIDWSTQLGLFSTAPDYIKGMMRASLDEKLGG